MACVVSVTLLIVNYLKIWKNKMMKKINITNETGVFSRGSDKKIINKRHPNNISVNTQIHTMIWP